jgi:uncharacterized protein with PIN domain
MDNLVNRIIGIRSERIVKIGLKRGDKVEISPTDAWGYCSGCGKWFWKGETIIVRNNQEFCPECADYVEMLYRNGEVGYIPRKTAERIVKENWKRWEWAYGRTVIREKP